MEGIEVPDTAGEEDELLWEFGEGEEIVPGIHAWAPLGDGRRTESWLAWSVLLWAPVVIKLPRPDRLGEDAVRTLAREAGMVSRLAHPSIQNLLAQRLEGPRPYLLFEYVEGPTLGGLLDDRGALPSDDVARLGMQLAGALHYLHGEGIAHLDLKPGNVAVRDGRAILLDFDVARRIGEGGTPNKPRGTAPYMAPEQVRCEAVAPSMDLFALGATLYEASTNVSPFDAPDENGKRVYPQMTRGPAPPRSVWADVTPALDDVILRLLEPAPARRPATALATLGLLQRALSPEGEGTWPAWVSGLLPD